MRRVRLPFVPGLDVEFVDRDRAIEQVMDWADRGTRFPVVIHGPEGCGKSAFLRQAAAILRELGYDAIYVDFMHMDFTAHTDAVKRLIDAVSEVSGAA